MRQSSYWQSSYLLALFSGASLLLRASLQKLNNENLASVEKEAAKAGNSVLAPAQASPAFMFSVRCLKSLLSDFHLKHCCHLHLFIPFWDVPPCTLVAVCQRFGSSTFHWNVSIKFYLSTLMMEVECSSETSTMPQSVISRETFLNSFIYRISFLCQFPWQRYTIVEELQWNSSSDFGSENLSMQISLHSESHWFKSLPGAKR